MSAGFWYFLMYLSIMASIPSAVAFIYANIANPNGPWTWLFAVLLMSCMALMIVFGVKYTDAYNRKDDK